MQIRRLIYNLVLLLLAPYVFLHLIWRARKQPEYLSNVRERFGFYATFSAKPVIWLHTVSVGETRAIQNLVNKLIAVYPAYQILLTHTTPTGRSTSLQLYGERILRVYLPYDYSFAVNLFLNHFHPKLAILLETEIWPNLVHACHNRRIPLLLLNARMSKKSMLRYARFSSFTKDVLNEISAIAAQTSDDANRLAILGGKNMSVCGNLKFDIQPSEPSFNLGQDLRNQIGADRPVLVAASTREGEELLLLDAFSCIDIQDLLLIIVPRHPQRFEEVAVLIRKSGYSFQRRSENQAISKKVKVFLGDSMGEMFAYYAAADLAFIGGSLLPYGGQNLIEACATGTPVLVGPYMYNFEESTKLAVSSGAAIMVSNTQELVKEVQRLFNDRSSLNNMKLQCSIFVNSNQGATDRSLEIIKKYLAD